MNSGEFPASEGGRNRGVASGDSLSGKERNHLFLNLGGEQFLDVAAASGLDHPADGRAIAALDYDRDGWTDFAVVNAITPLLQLYRNEIAEVRDPAAGPPGVLALRFEGANRSPGPAPDKSPRDGYGAVARLRVGATTLVREHRAGEGLASQSSATQLVGLGPARRVDALTVRWPSGVEQSHGPLPAGSLVTLYEDPAASPDGSGLAIEPYRRAAGSNGDALPARREAARPGPPLGLAAASPTDAVAGPPLRIWTTMATWCEACKGELGQVAKLRRAFPESRLDLVGVPVDEDDDADALAAYRGEHAPAYRMLEPLSAEQRAEVSQLLLDRLWIDTLPASIVTDAEGRVLAAQARLPSVSQVRRWLAAEAGP